MAARAALEGVGVRELRQNLSVYLQRVAAGETLRVTDRGHDVALLVPLAAQTSTVERLVASGRATPARADLRAIGRPKTKTRQPLSRALADVSADRV
jgi:prevent-host-death family protein